MRKKERQQKGKNILKVLPIVGVVILIIVVLIILKNVAAGNKVNFWSVTNEMVNADHTQYNYTLTIDTSDSTKTNNSTSGTMSKEDVENVEAEGTTEDNENTSGSATTGSGVSSSKGKEIEYNVNNAHFSNVWSDASGVEDYANSDVKCTLEISGYTEGDNFKTSLKLGCDGNSASDLFDIMFIDGTYYLGVGNFKDGLKSSGVGSLVKLGNDLPDGVRYLTIPEKEFVVLTGLDEKSGQGYLKTRDGAVEMLQRSINVFLGKIQTYTDKKTLKKQKQDESVTCGFTCSDSSVIFDALKNYLAYDTENYKAQINDMVDGKYISKEDKNVALSELDNLAKFDSKYLEIINAMSDEDIKNSGVEVNAQITREGKKIYKPNYRLEFNREGKHYTIGFSGECNLNGSGDKLVAPEETSLAISEYDNGGEGWKSYFIRFINYFNVFGVDLETGTAKTVGDLSKDMLDALCTTLNTAHSGEDGWTQVNRGTLSDYIEAHSEDDEVVKSFLETFNKYTLNDNSNDTDTNNKAKASKKDKTKEASNN